MRQIFLSAAIALMAGSAMASSIEVVGKGAPTDNGSILTETCETCPPLQATLAKKDYVVPTLQSGTFQSSQIRDIAGEKKLFRTEGWMGGSPVVFVTRAPEESMTASAPAAAPSDGVDMAATTSAVIGGDAKPVAAAMAPAEQTAPLDVSSFKLRP
jgi:hypothetical protein